MVIRFAPIAVLVAALPIFLAATPASHAQLVLTLTAPDQAGTAPGTFAFTGTLANPTMNDIALYSDTFKFDDPIAGLSLDDSPFNNNAPTTLAAHSTYTGDFFNVSVDPAVAPGTYGGTFSILDGNPLDKPVASPGFSVTVLPLAPAVPEASTTVSLGLLLALGLGGIVVARRRKPAYDSAL